jgi:endonuclease V-like protein UPF0215 family
LTPLKVAGVEDGSFQTNPSNDGSAIQYTPLCITKMLGRRLLSVDITPITVDGLDSTKNLLRILKKIEVDVAILGGITFGGFNIVDAELLNIETGIPMIVFTADEPKNFAIKNALIKNFIDWRLRWARIEKLKPFNSVKIHKVKPIFYETIGCNNLWAEEVLRSQCINSRVPEAVRVAKMIARGVSPFF